jgi:hypothetical protein
MFFVLLHVLVQLITILYPVFTLKLVEKSRHVCDLVFICIILGINLHWVFLKNECIISFWEKQQIDPTYKLGECPFVHPFAHFVSGRFTDENGIKYFMSAIQLLSALSFMAVLWRVKIGGQVKLAILGAFLALIILSKLSRPAITTPRCKEIEAKCVAAFSGK